MNGWASLIFRDSAFLYSEFQIVCEPVKGKLQKVNNSGVGNHMGNSEIQKFGNRNIWNLGKCEIGKLGNSEIRKFGNFKIRKL